LFSAVSVTVLVDAVALTGRPGVALVAAASAVASAAVVCVVSTGSATFTPPMYRFSVPLAVAAAVKAIEPAAAVAAGSSASRRYQTSPKVSFRR
jgi:hypothetical protein